MLAILQQLHLYLPMTGNGEIDPQIIAGDQLTIERATNAIHSVANDYTPEDRLEGLILQTGDWHAGLKILSVSYLYMWLVIMPLKSVLLSASVNLIVKNGHVGLLAKKLSTCNYTFFMQLQRVSQISSYIIHVYAVLIQTLRKIIYFFLQLIYKRFFSGKSEIDSCTLNSDRNLINRRNVKADPHDAYRPNRDFLLIVLKSRVVVTAMQYLVHCKTSQPTKCPLPEDLDQLPNTTKLNYLHKAASLVVDNFVFEVETTDKLFDDILSAQQ